MCEHNKKTDMSVFYSIYEVNLYPILSTLNLDVACFSKMSVLDYKTVLC
jgi:hypothetical protein